MHGYDPEMPSNSISKHLLFLGGHVSDPPKFSIYADLQMVGLTTEKLLPTALPTLHTKLKKIGPVVYEIFVSENCPIFHCLKIT